MPIELGGNRAADGPLGIVLARTRCMAPLAIFAYAYAIVGNLTNVRQVRNYVVR